MEELYGMAQEDVNKNKTLVGSNRGNAKMTWTSDKVRLKTPGQNALIKHANESHGLLESKPCES